MVTPIINVIKRINAKIAVKKIQDTHTILNVLLHFLNLDLISIMGKLCVKNVIIRQKDLTKRAE